MSDAGRKKGRGRGLGRGLSALMSDVSLDSVTADSTQKPNGLLSLPIERVVPNPDQPRRTFDEGELEDLANSIREKGIIQPLIVRALEDGTHQIVAGERRWRAAQMAQLHEVPAVLRDLTDTEVLELAIIENIQRADLNPIEEAQAFAQLIERFGHTQEQLARALGISRSHIANMMRLLKLPASVRDLLSAGQLSQGHARALITSIDPASLARVVVEKGLSVRETEKLAKTGQVPKVRQPTLPTDKDADTRALENDISANLGLKVAIAHPPSGEAGQITIRYKDLSELDALCRLLTATPLDVSR